MERLRRLCEGGENDGSYRLRCLWISVDDNDEGGAAMVEEVGMLGEGER